MADPLTLMITISEAAKVLWEPRPNNSSARREQLLPIHFSAGIGIGHHIGLGL